MHPHYPWWPTNSIARNATLHNKTPTNPNTGASLGNVELVADTENSTQRMIARINVRNTSGGNLGGSGQNARALKYQDGQYGLMVDGYAHSLLDAHFAGWLDEKLVRAVADDDVLPLILGGPANRELYTNDLIPNIFDYLRGRKALHGIDDDFLTYVSGDEWTIVASNSGTVAGQEGVGGQIIISPSDGSVADNDETYLKGTRESYLFAANKPIYLESRIRLNEVNGEANIILGLKDAVAADSILDDGAGPAASYSGFVFFKVDGGSVWQGEVSVAGTQVTDSNVGAFSDNAWQTLRAIWRPTSATSATVDWYVDGVYGGSTTHTYTSGTEMQACIGVKNGADTNHQQLEVDYFTALQLR